MRKKSIIGITIFMVWGILVIGLVSVDKIVSSESNVYTTIEEHAIFAEIYDDYDKLISDAEVVALGTVKNVNSYMKDTRIVSKFDFEVSSVDKGDININNTISVSTIGGKVTYSDYLDANKQYLEAKTSPEYISEEKRLYGNEYIESIYEGVLNVQDGDQLVLFLSVLDDKNYYILGSSYFGQFYYDNKNNEMFKEIRENTLDRKKTKKEMIINRKDFKEKVKKSKDNSKIRKEQIQNIINSNIEEK